MEPMVCPVCEHPRVVKLSDHLIGPPNISDKEGKLYFEEHVLRLCHAKMENHLYIQLPHSLVTVFQKHPHYLSKRNYQIQYHPTLHQTKIKTS